MPFFIAPHVVHLDDPDGEGPAEGILIPPMTVFETDQTVASSWFPISPEEAANGTWLDRWMAQL